MRDAVDLTLFTHVVRRPDDEIELGQAALLIAAGEYPGLDITSYVDQLAELGAQGRARLGDSFGTARIERLLAWFGGELGFRGNSTDYYDPRNSFLNDVVDRRTGIPISLAIVMLEICRRANVEANGVSFPGHFLVRADVGGGIVLIDPFDVTVLNHSDLRAIHERATGDKGDPDWRLLAGASKRQILLRLLNNLRTIYAARGDHERLRPVLERMDVLAPSDELRSELATLRGTEVRSPRAGRYDLN